jgi:hypothetical protein
MIFGEKAIADLQIAHFSVEHCYGGGGVFDEQAEQSFIRFAGVFEPPALSHEGKQQDRQDHNQKQNCRSVQHNSSLLAEVRSSGTKGTRVICAFLWQ